MDFFTPQILAEVGTVLIGFIIFFMILKKFAWGPILGVLDERQEKIKEGFDEVKQLQADTAETHKRYEEKLRDIEAEARAKIQQAVNEGKAMAAQETEKARAEAAAMIEKAKRSIQLETEKARKQIREEIISLTLHATEKLIKEKLSAERDRELVGSFITDLESQDS